MSVRWKPFDPERNWPDLGTRFVEGEKAARRALHEAQAQAPLGGGALPKTDADADAEEVRPDAYGESMEEDKRDLDWAAVLKRIFESYIRGERANMYGEWLVW